MKIYPYTPSQLAAASATDLLAFVKSPTLLARRLGEILTAQQFIGNSLLQGRYTLQGGAIAVPSNEKIRTDRRAETVAPGAEYKLTPLSAEQYEVYTGSKEGIATEVTDEEVGRSLRQPIDDAMLLLQTELVFNANELALGVITSSVTQTLAGAAWTNGKQILKDALRAEATIRRLKLGYSVDTVVLNSLQYAEVLPELTDLLPSSDTSAITGNWPKINGLTWIASDDDEISDPLFVDSRRLGGIARENIPSPEYRPVGGDTGVEIASIREPRADKSRLQARNPHVPVVTNPLAGIFLTGTGA
ncbi:hypothetical protein SAMN04489740_0995 [Arthrobacter alpinus]|uniref:Major capsid protein n=1 Tax=Arthrobacter alpinus TaxID=656366 RepID=A0A1H5HF16_9MICC|nr:hypothetical protein [Arthrobacter alpinus]SEE26334.1 hypothetical protein SAMN04489740_0995 [Arthrobacter alpinus]